MSFGSSQSVKNAQNFGLGVTQQANASADQLAGLGNTNLGTGSTNVNSGTNFFNSLLNGNSANTAATLQPSINQIRRGTAENIQALSTLTPRGGGRSGALFNASYAPQAQIQNLFNQGRTQAATTLPQIGLQQEGIGANLFGLGNQARQLALQGTQNQFQNAFGVQNRSDNLVGQLGQGVASAFTNLPALFL